MPDIRLSVKSKGLTIGRRGEVHVHFGEKRFSKMSVGRRSKQKRKGIKDIEETNQWFFGYSLGRQEGKAPTPGRLT